MMLSALQRQLATSIRHYSDTALPLIRHTGAVDCLTRLGVYQQAYIVRLDEALRANFPKLHLLLGDNDFFDLTRAYAAAHPSRRASIRWFGDQLADWLDATPPYAGLAAMTELAKLEWALGCAFDAADAPCASGEALVALSDEEWETLQPRFHPSLSRLTLHSNAIAIWQALNAQQAPPAPESAHQVWAIWRQDLQPRFRSLSPDEASLLQALQGGQPFGVACDALLVWHDESSAPGRAAGLLGQWLAEGWITALR